MKLKLGFTLIELLIVVAIIAILAAIAVPNFLEAQVRAKASRAKSDLRSAITALESYMVDNNKYPIPRYETTQLKWINGYVGNSAVQFLPGGFHQCAASLGAFAPGSNVAGLTTPIAYLTSVPRDPFSTGVFPEQLPGQYTEMPYQNIAAWIDPGLPMPNGEATSPVGVGADAGQTNHLTPDYLDSYGNWIIRSIGPDKSFNSAIVPYDATNGSVSFGDIYRTQKREHNNRSIGGE